MRDGPFLSGRWREARKLPCRCGQRHSWLQGTWPAMLGHSEQGEVLCQESLALFRAIGDTKGMGTALFNLAMVAEWSSDFAAARSRYEESMVLSREVGNTNLVAWALDGLAQVAIFQGEYARARLLLEESLALFRELGYQYGHCPLALLVGTCIVFARRPCGSACSGRRVPRAFQGNRHQDC